LKAKICLFGGLELPRMLEILPFGTSALPHRHTKLARDKNERHL